ncbi:DUF2460 domain-containing protein [Lyticum sinuosum]|uniref:DUF2460 superfamily domain n=1 Tax=Lyticum sinuosum TaxID=1332059 RepID=A0AAE4VKT2_9RICK|nr:DUF2460 domain-containing protein [Lyticum sinuosum]MDZ5761258.1 DUF2460 superfamily domain [Lyticum sinuosum]
MKIYKENNINNNFDIKNDIQVKKEDYKYHSNKNYKVDYLLSHNNISNSDNFLKILFPEDISCGSSSSIEYSTSVSQGVGGHEQRNINWCIPKMKFTIPPSIRDYNKLSEIISLFRIAKGRAFCFLFKDWGDYTVKNQIIGYGDGNKKSFMLFKEYILNKFKEIRLINKPRIDSCKIFIDDKLCSSKLYTIDNDNGIITFSIPPSFKQQISFSCFFDILVRFDMDYLNYTVEGSNIYEIGEIKLIEVKWSRYIFSKTDF